MVLMIAPLVLLACLGGPPAAPPGSGNPPQDPAREAQSEHVKRGTAHFNRAFYQLTPRKRDLEASREFDLAVAAFEAGLQAGPSAEAHRYLGRICALRGQFRDAARHYDTLSGLDPADVDACVLAAVAWADAGEFAAARERLLEAKGRTTERGALSRLDEYLAKLDGRGPVPLP